MDIHAILHQEPNPLHLGGPSGPIILSTRVRLARNLSDIPFPARATAQQKQQILSLCQKGLDHLEQTSKISFVNIDELSVLERQVLVERHLISPEFANSEGPRGLMMNKNQTVCIMVNEEDHLRIQVLAHGLQLKKAWKQADALDTLLEAHMPYAFHPQWGYLTACPTNLGTAMRASVMMHLPALVMTHEMEAIVRAVNQLGLAVRGLFGEGSDASGSIFQISNQQTLGEDELSILYRLKGVIQTIIDKENQARQKLLTQNSNNLFDRIGRAFGILRYSHQITSIDALNLLSLLRLAIDLGIIADEHRVCIDRLLIQVQPGHLQLGTHSSTLPDQRDTLRATTLRSALSPIHKLDFDALYPPASTPEGQKSQDKPQQEPQQKP
jgi:protein arginine kinase